MMLSLEVRRRKAAFKSALILAGLTQKAWAAQQGVTAPHLSQVLHGTRPSDSLTAKIDAFIAETATATTSRKSAA